MKYNTVIWDFNGTILDDVEAGIVSVNTLLGRRGLRQIASLEEYYSVFGFPIEDYYRRLGFDFSKEKYADIADEWVVEYLENQKKSPLCNGVYDLAVKLKQKGVSQYVISMTEVNMLRRQLSDLGIIGLFDGVEGLDNVRAHSKRALALEWAKGRDLTKSVLLGDTTHDYEVAEAIGADCILVAAGHQSRETLSACPCKIVDCVSDIPELSEDDSF